MTNFEIVCGIVGISQAIGAYGAPHQDYHHTHRSHKTGGIGSLLAFFLALLNSIIFAVADPNYWLYLYMGDFLWAILVTMACSKLLSGFKKGAFHHEFPSISKSLGTIGAMLVAAAYIFGFVYG